MASKIECTSAIFVFQHSLFTEQPTYSKVVQKVGKMNHSVAVCCSITSSECNMLLWFSDTAMLFFNGDPFGRRNSLIRMKDFF